ncbi:MAG: glycosyltransferase [Salibacteraceae bacterium]
MAEKILIAPLHWGLGHAARCIPLIRKELDRGNEVLIAANDGPEALLHAHFPELEVVEIPFMVITYPADGNMMRHFFWRGPKFLWNIWKEHAHLKTLIKKHQITKVISDGRFGLWNRSVFSVFVHHQIEIKTPRFQGLVNWLNRWVMNQYDEVWIPDFNKKPGLAGELSHPAKMPKRFLYIGPLSRFQAPLSKTGKWVWDAVAIVSGPEPQRSLFEVDVVRRYLESGQRLLLLRGKPHETDEKNLDNIKIVNHLNDHELYQALSQAKKVISRSGYSTIMDFYVLGVNEVEWHPTPGQTEQEYLAKLHSEK